MNHGRTGLEVAAAAAAIGGKEERQVEKVCRVTKRGKEKVGEGKLCAVWVTLKVVGSRQTLLL